VQPFLNNLVFAYCLQFFPEAVYYGKIKLVLNFRENSFKGEHFTKLLLITLFHFINTIDFFLFFISFVFDMLFVCLNPLRF